MDARTKPWEVEELLGSRNLKRRAAPLTGLVTKRQRSVLSEPIVISSDDEIQMLDSQDVARDNAAKRVQHKEQSRKEAAETHLAEEAEFDNCLYDSHFKAIPLNDHAEETLPIPTVPADREVTEFIYVPHHSATISDDNRILNAKPITTTVKYSYSRQRGHMHRHRYWPPTQIRTPIKIHSTAGAVNRIFQSSGCVVVAGAVFKGDVDERDSLEHYYDKQGTLNLFQPRQVEHNIGGRVRFRTELHTVPVDEHIALRKSYRRRCYSDRTFRYASSFEMDEQEITEEANDRKRNEERRAIDEEKLRQAREAGDDPEESSFLTSLTRSEYRWTEYEFQKLYTVNSIAYDPRSDIIASSSTERKIRFTVVRSDTATLGYERPAPFSIQKWVPHELAFSPTTLQTAPMLAVAAKQIVLYTNPLSADDRSSQQQLELTKRKDGNIVGCLLWGRGPATAQYIYALSEPETVFVAGSGRHMAFDPCARTTALFRFDTTDSGDEMALSPNGENLALITGHGSQRFLRIYDVARKDSITRRLVSLESFDHGDEHAQVNCVAYSPDGIYITTARTDNSLDIYDSRVLGRVLQRFHHSAPTKVLKYDETHSEPSYGVVQAEWVRLNRSGRPGIVTGSVDGFVRLWDPNMDQDDPANGLALAEIDCDIGRFNIGDRSKGEYDLIVGGSNGKVSFYDRLPHYHKVVEEI